MSDWLDPERQVHPWEEVTDHDKYDEQGMPAVDPELERLLAEEEEIERAHKKPTTIEQKIEAADKRKIAQLENQLTIYESNINRLGKQVNDLIEARDRARNELAEARQERDQLKVDLIFLATQIEDLPLAILRYTLRGMGHS